MSENAERSISGPQFGGDDAVMQRPESKHKSSRNDRHLSVYGSIDHEASLESGVSPSTTATAPTLLPSDWPLSRAMAEMTSAGSSRCQVASVCLELAPTVVAKTWSSGSLEERRARNMSTGGLVRIW
nr:hypothetical protein CFP56_48829 [Quercus suber]